MLNLNSLIISPYFWFLFFFAFLAVIELFNPKNSLTRIMFVCGLVLLVLLIGFRHGSPDQATYEIIFNHMPTLDALWLSDQKFEQYVMRHGLNTRPYLDTFFVFNGGLERTSPGMGFLISVVKSFGTYTPIALFTMIGAIVVGSAASLCVRLSPLPILSFCLFFSWFIYPAFGALKHAAAMGFFMMFLALAVNRQSITSCVALLSGASMHFALLPTLFVLPIYKFLANRKMCVFIFVSSLTIAVLLGGVTGFVFQNFDSYLPYLFTERYQAYKLAHEISGRVGFLPNTLISGVFFKQCIVLLACFVFYETAQKKFKYFNFLTLWYTIGVASYLLFLDVSIIASRLSHLLTVVEIILIPILVHSIELGRYTVIFRYVLVFASLGLCYIQFLLLHGVQFREYQFVSF